MSLEAGLAGCGVATVYEGSGRQGLVDIPLSQILAGSCVAGRARTVMCGQDDNLMLHAALSEVQPGEVLVVTMPEPRPVGLLGELLATQAIARRVAAVLVDAAVRDVEDLATMGLPIWARWTSVRGATKDLLGSINVPVAVGGTVIVPGDIVVLDRDGAVAVSAEGAEAVLAASEERRKREQALRVEFAAGKLSYDLFDFRARVEAMRREASGAA